MEPGILLGAKTEPLVGSFSAGQLVPGPLLDPPLPPVPLVPPVLVPPPPAGTSGCEPGASRTPASLLPLLPPLLLPLVPAAPPPTLSVLPPPLIPPEPAALPLVAVAPPAAVVPPVPNFSPGYRQPAAVAATRNNPSLDTPCIDATFIDSSLAQNVPLGATEPGPSHRAARGSPSRFGGRNAVIAKELAHFKRHVPRR